MLNPKGRIARTTRVSLDIEGREFRCYAYRQMYRIKASAAWRNRFFRAFRSMGLHGIRYDNGYWELFGDDLEALARMAHHPAVVLTEAVLSVRVPWTAAGSGPDKVRAFARPPKFRSPLGDVGQLPRTPSETQITEEHMAIDFTQAKPFVKPVSSLVGEIASR